MDIEDTALCDVCGIINAIDNCVRKSKDDAIICLDCLDKSKQIVAGLFPDGFAADGVGLEVVEIEDHS